MRDLVDIEHFGRLLEKQEILDNKYSASPDCLFLVAAYVGPDGKVAVVEEIAAFEFVDSRPETPQEGSFSRKSEWQQDDPSLVTTNSTVSEHAITVKRLVIRRFNVHSYNVIPVKSLAIKRVSALVEHAMLAEG